jgi:hypothetical protein
MGMLMTICPVTGRNIETGIETDKRTMAGAGAFSARIACSQCGGEHAISNQDAWVCETIGGRQEFSPEA